MILLINAQTEKQTKLCPPESVQFLFLQLKDLFVVVLLVHVYLLGLSDLSDCLLSLVGFFITKLTLEVHQVLFLKLEGTKAQ